MKMKFSVPLLVCLFLVSNMVVLCGAVAEDDRADSRVLNGWDESSTGLPTDGPWSSVAVGDFNNDNYPDIVSAEWDMGAVNKAIRVWTSKDGASFLCQ